MSYFVIDKMVPLNFPIMFSIVCKKPKMVTAAIPVVRHKPMGGILWRKSG